jgi:Uncharacterised nucleotidyltransferase
MSAASAAIRTEQVQGGRFRPELELLLASAAGPLNGARSRQVGRILDQPLDWEFLLELADQHGLTPLFFWNTQSFRNAMPAPFLARLRSHYEANARKSLLLCNILAEVQELLRGENIACMVLKGPAVALGIYGDIALREFSDLDLLVRQSDILRAKEILVTSGFEPAVRLSPAQERLCLRWDNEFPFHRGPHQNLIELQWRIAPFFYAVDFDLDAQFERAIPINLGKAGCRTLCPEDLLVVLCVHAAKHAWGRLAWLCDIAWLLRTQNLDWTQVRQQAERLGLERILLVTLALTRDFYGSNLPAFSQRDISESPAVRRLCLEIGDCIIHQKHLDISSSEYFCLLWRLRERWRDRFRFLMRLTFTPGPGEWSSVALPSVLSPAYVAVRAFRLTGKLLRRHHQAHD